MNATTISDEKRAALISELEAQIDRGRISLPEYWERKAKLEIAEFGDFIPSTPAPPPSPEQMRVAELDARAAAGLAKYEEFHRDLTDKLNNGFPERAQNPYSSPAVLRLVEMAREPFADEQFVPCAAEELRREGWIGEAEYDAVMDLIAGDSRDSDLETPTDESSGGIRFDDPLVREIVQRTDGDLDLALTTIDALYVTVGEELFQRVKRAEIAERLKAPKGASNANA